MHSGADSLFTHRFFVRAGLAAGAVFAWVLAFDFAFFVSGSFYGALSFTLLLYIASQLVTFLLTPLSGRLLRFGFRRLMTYGTLALALAFASLSLGLQELLPAVSMWGGLLLFAIFFGAYRALYWIPYGVGAAAYAKTRPLTKFYAEVLLAVLPLAAGVLFLLPLGAASVFLSSTVLALLSVPLLGSIPNVREEYAWGYGETYARLFRPAHRAIVLSGILAGVESTALFLVWPISVFLIVGERYDILGAALAATLLILALGRGFVLRAFSFLKIGASPAVEASVRFSAWVLRLTAAGPAAVVAVDTYYYLASPHRSEAPDAASFEQAGDSGTYVDELTALKELGLVIGRVLVCMLAFSLIPIGIPAVILAAPMLAAAVAAAVSVFVSRGGF